MSLVKRDYCGRFAKEDVRRAKAGETCLTTYFSVMSDLPPEVAKNLQKFVKHEATYIKTVEAWVRRVTNIKMNTLQRMMQFVDDDITLSESRGQSPDHDDQKTHISATICDSKSVVSLTDDGSVHPLHSTLTEDATNNRSEAGREPSVVGLATGREPSVVAPGSRHEHSVVELSEVGSATGRAPSVVASACGRQPSVVGSATGRAPSVVGVASACGRQPSVVGSAAGRAPSVVGVASASGHQPSVVGSAAGRAPSVVASASGRQPSVVGSAAEREPSVVGSATGRPESTTLITLAESSNLAEHEHTEQAVNDWYNVSCAKLEEHRARGKLRMEQFKRKRALLRVEYWAKLDKLRNNATPTVIGDARSENRV